jgi:predicted metal-dependent phosphoesterase TrpH
MRMMRWARPPGACRRRRRKRQVVTRVDYHFHTSHSYDGRATLQEVLAAARRAGLTTLCVTDHDTIDGAVALRALAGGEFEVVVGCEFTCVDGSHVVGLGLQSMIPERRIVPLMDRIHGQGGLVLLPHLFRRGSGVFRRELRRTDAFVEEVLARGDLVECFNGRDTFDHNAQSRAFAAERGLARVASSDAHRADEIGSVFVEYDRAEPLHGRSTRRIWHPSQRELHEHPLKRAAMDLYHRHAAALPPFVRAGYRAVRARLALDDAARGRRPPVLQYQFGVAEGGDRDARHG